VAKRYTIGDRVEVATISFGLEQAGVDEKRSQNLPALVKILKDNPYWVVEIGCHTDATGSTQHNLNLSQQRANAVKNYLIQKGIDPARLLAKGYGESRVLNRCKDGVRCSAAEHAVNRRTEFTIIGLRGFKVGDLLDVDEIYYESGQDKLDLNNANGLRELVLILKNTSIRVEIGSHTDSQGSDSFNKEISEKRAKAVYEYLIQKGIPRSRISYVGYGESQILNKCKEGVSCTEEEHAVNRRTVFKVVALK
jgi:outer membrane protein OmpA-like peptidoglycan-associated protein